MLSDRCLSCPVCDVDVLWQNGWVDQDATCYGGRPRPGHIVLCGDPAPPRKGARQLPTFAIYGRSLRPYNRGSCLMWPNSWMDQDSTWYRGRPWPKPQCVRWGPSSPTKRAQRPPILAMSIVAKRLDGSRCHLVVGTEVGLGPGDILLDGDSAAPKRGHISPPLFGSCLLWPNGRPSQQLLSSCSFSVKTKIYGIHTHLTYYGSQSVRSTPMSK